jgi:Carboxypeptidase regulatory-like domain
MRLSVRLLTAAMLLLTVQISFFAQSQLGTGALSGTVQDAGGAVIVGAEITVTNDDTGLTRKSTTNEAGQFTVPVLPVGPPPTATEGLRLVLPLFHSSCHALKPGIVDSSHSQAEMRLYLFRRQGVWQRIPDVQVEHD